MRWHWYLSVVVEQSLNSLLVIDCDVVLYTPSSTHTVMNSEFSSESHTQIGADPHNIQMSSSQLSSDPEIDDNKHYVNLLSFDSNIDWALHLLSIIKNDPSMVLKLPLSPWMILTTHFFT